MKLLIIARSDYVQKYSHLSNKYSYTVMYVYGTKQSINRIKIDNKKEGYNIDVKHIDEFKDEILKFDYIVGNPPYQETTGDTTKPIWDKIILKSFALLKQNGEMSLIHPGGWRFATEKSKGAVKEVKDIYQTNQLTYLELNDVRAGIEKFGVQTDYDVITLIKKPVEKLIKIKTKDGLYSINIKNLKVIPTNKFKEYETLLAKNGEKTVNIINDYNYGSDERFKHISKIKNNEFKYPVVYTITNKDGLICYYSNTNKKGHFGIPKLILKKAAPKTVLDLNGKYGMTQFAYGLIDTPENLVKIQKCLESEVFCNLQVEFTNALNKTTIDGLGTMIKFIKTFKKDFWKEFYTPEMEQELIKEGKLDKEGKYIE